VAREVDLDGAEEAFRRAAELARELGDDAALATALREIGVVLIGRLRAWFVEQVAIGAHIPIEHRVAAGETLDQIVIELPIAPMVYECHGLLSEALGLFEQLGDRRGSMASIIAMAYLSWAPDIHLGTGAARHIEEIRRLTSRMKAFTNESERAAFEAQMLYGVHVFARAKVIPDLALLRGAEAYARAQEIGDQNLEFLAAGGTAMAHVDLGEPEEARKWLDRASAVASAHPTPLRARRLETWRGLTDAVAGDAEGMRRHLERAVELAAEARQPAARCEAVARVAVACAALGAERGDDALLDVAEDAARAASEAAVGLPGHPPWAAEADAALAHVALARGRGEEAVEHARSAIGRLRSANHEDRHFDVLLPAARVILAVGAPEWEQLQPFLATSLAMIVQRTIDEDIRVRWLRGPIGRALSELAGPIEPVPVGERAAAPDADTALLRSLVQGKTNREIADELGTDEQTVSRRLAELFTQIGATSRAEATAFAFAEGVL
jgi:DNA-binding CsgD family transcriptional regulator/tetratricopeptide (TPR) repeat protein